MGVGPGSKSLTSAERAENAAHGVRRVRVADVATNRIPAGSDETDDQRKKIPGNHGRDGQGKNDHKPGCLALKTQRRADQTSRVRFRSLPIGIVRLLAHSVRYLVRANLLRAGPHGRFNRRVPVNSLSTGREAD